MAPKKGKPNQLFGQPPIPKGGPQKRTAGRKTPTAPKNPSGTPSGQPSSSSADSVKNLEILESQVIFEKRWLAAHNLKFSENAATRIREFHDSSQILKWHDTDSKAKFTWYINGFKEAVDSQGRIEELLDTFSAAVRMDAKVYLNTGDWEAVFSTDQAIVQKPAITVKDLAKFYSEGSFTRLRAAANGTDLVKAHAALRILHQIYKQAVLGKKVAGVTDPAGDTGETWKEAKSWEDVLARIREDESNNPFQAGLGKKQIEYFNDAVFERRVRVEALKNALSELEEKHTEALIQLYNVGRSAIVDAYTSTAGNRTSIKDAGIISKLDKTQTTEVTAYEDALATELAALERVLQNDAAKMRVAELREEIDRIDEELERLDVQIRGTSDVPKRGLYLLQKSSLRAESTLLKIEKTGEELVATNTGSDEILAKVLVFGEMLKAHFKGVLSDEVFGTPRGKLQASFASLYEKGVRYLQDNGKIDFGDDGIPKKPVDSRDSQSTSLTGFASAVDQYEEAVRAIQAPSTTTGGAPGEADNTNTLLSRKVASFKGLLKTNREILTEGVDLNTVEGQELKKELDKIMGEWENLAPTGLALDGHYDIYHGVPYLPYGKNIELQTTLSQLQRRHQDLRDALNRLRDEQKKAQMIEGFDRQRAAADDQLDAIAKELETTEESKFPDFYDRAATAAWNRGIIDATQIAKLTELAQRAITGQANRTVMPAMLAPPTVFFMNQFLRAKLAEYPSQINLPVGSGTDAIELKMALNKSLFEVLQKALEILKSVDDAKGVQPNLLLYEHRENEPLDQRVTDELMPLIGAYNTALDAHRIAAGRERRTQLAREEAERKRKEAEQEEQERKRRSDRRLSTNATPTSKPKPASKSPPVRRVDAPRGASPTPPPPPYTFTPSASRREPDEPKKTFVFDFDTLQKGRRFAVPTWSEPKPEPVLQKFVLARFWEYGPWGTNGFSEDDDKLHWEYVMGLKPKPKVPEQKKRY